MIMSHKKNISYLIIVLYILTITGMVLFSDTSGLYAKGAYITPFDYDSVDLAPQIRSYAIPRYPFTAKKGGVVGKVVLKFVVDTNGIPQEPIVVKSEPEGVFDKAALDSISYYRFKPAVKDGKDVACIVKLPIRFTPQTDNELDWSNAYKIDEVDQSPMVLEDVSPVYPPSAKKDGVEGFVVLQFVVGTDGYAYDPVITNSIPGEVFDNAALDALYDYRFQPAKKNGEYVNCIMSLTIMFDSDK